jgi:predicted CxxxxCH...CXXCH cytochrome family protein
VARRSSTTQAILCGLLASWPSGCRARREPAQDTVAYRADIGPLLAARCASCHGPLRAEAGWRADSYLGAIGCVAGRGVTLASGTESAPLVTALSRADHVPLLDADERALVIRWIDAGAPAGRGVHESAFVDPRSPASHGAFLRGQRYRALLDAQSPDRCAVCHDGAGTKNVQTAPGATACTTCHTEPEGVLACSTCHGQGAAAFPPRDACFFPNDARGSHAAHVQPSAARSEGLACGSCHPVPAAGQFDLAHADGFVEIAFDRSTSFGARATFDLSTQRCAATCHDAGGARPQPAWGEAAMGCGDCHGSPPAKHDVGPCTNCHAEPNADGTALRAATLHLNGRADRGDGSGQCGSCHGSGADPWPRTGAHQAHAHPANAAPVDCGACHETPGASHPQGGVASVRFAGLALGSGHTPVYDASTRTCAQTYCHDSRGGAQSPRWDQGAMTCSSCHASPPPAPHAQSTSCGGVACHQDGDAATMSMLRAPLHVNGRIDR